MGQAIMDITAAIEYVVGLWRQIPGVRLAPDEPTDTAPAFPYCITYEANGEVEMDNNYAWGPQLGLIRSELHVERVTLAKAIAQALPYRNQFLRKIFNDPNLGGTVMIVQTVRWRFEPSNYNGVDTIRYQFDLNVILELSAT